MFGTGFSGSSAWAQPVDSLGESTGNSQPGPQQPKARYGTGYKGSNAWAAKGKVVGLTLLSLSPQVGLALLAPSLGKTVAVAT